MADLGKRTYLQHFSSVWGVAELQDYLQEHFAPDTLTAQLADTQYRDFLIASIAGQPVGFVKINWQEQEPTLGQSGAELERLCIDARFTGRGIGALLLKSSLILAKELNQDELWLRVLAENDGAQRFFRRYGFATIGHVPFNTDAQKTALVVMVLSLAAVGDPRTK